MSAESVTKKRGRPKKVVLEEALVINIEPEPTPETGSRKPKTTKRTQSTEADQENTASTKKTTRKSSTKIQREDKETRSTASTPVKSRRSAKKTESIDEEKGELQSISTSKILQQAKGFQELSANGKTEVARSKSNGNEALSASHPAPIIENSGSTSSNPAEIKQPLSEAKQPNPVEIPSSEAKLGPSTTEATLETSIPPISSTKPSASTPTTTSSMDSKPTSKPSMKPPSRLPSTTTGPIKPNPPAAAASGSNPLPAKPRPTQMPYEELKKDPRFKALSRRWTSLIVGLPVVIVTSYMLWDRFDEHAKLLQKGEVPSGVAWLFESRVRPPPEQKKDESAEQAE